MTAEEMALEVKRLAEQLVEADRKDLLLRAIGVPMLEELTRHDGRIQGELLLHQQSYEEAHRWARMQR